LIVLIIVVLIALGSLIGYGSGLSRRLSAQSTQVAGQLQEQFQLGIKAMDAGQYELARQYLEFVLQHNPLFPGAKTAYVDLLLRMQLMPSPSATLTLTMTPTLDLRGAQVVYDEIKGILMAPNLDLCSRDWDTILNKLDSLRQMDSTFHGAEVDGIYYIALRSRGVCKIYPQAYSTNTPCSELPINLEGGVYDLTQAERFGPLDERAANLRYYARLYVTAASFWNLDWPMAQMYFNQVRSALPSLSDSSCNTAVERWRGATIEVAGQLLAQGDPCGAQEQYLAAFSVNSVRNEPYFPIATEVYHKCHGGGGISTPTPTETLTPVTLTPTVTPTATLVPSTEPSPTP